MVFLSQLQITANIFFGNEKPERNLRAGKTLLQNHCNVYLKLSVTYLAALQVIFW